MTVAKKLRTNKAALAGLVADFKSSALENDDEHIRSMFLGYSRDLEQVLKDIDNRIKEIELEEPQYKE